jgi:Protein of unknown function (DUF3224)
MTTHGTGTFTITGWDEKPYEEDQDGGKLTKAHVTASFEGEITGDGSVEYLMAYPDESYASIVGLQRVKGAVGDRSGSFVLVLAGTFEGGKARCDWSVVPGSGTGDLKGLSGIGNFVTGEAGSADYTFDYDVG